jgi:hypothetical protein
MKLKQLVAEAMVAGGLGLPAVGLGVGVANADPPFTPPPVPTPTHAKTMANGNKVVPTITATPFSFAGLPVVQTAPATATANGGRSVPTVTAAPFGGEAPRFSNMVGLNRRGWVAHDLRVFPSLVGLVGPAGRAVP